jgi:hypothetical protein
MLIDPTNAIIPIIPSHPPILSRASNGAVLQTGLAFSSKTAPLLARLRIGG